MSNRNTAAWSFGVDHVNDWAYWDKLFSDDECNEIIKICKTYKVNDGIIKINNEEINGFDVDVKYRKSNVAFIGPEGLEWAFQKLTDACVSLNDRFFKFDIWGFSEGLQFTEYSAPGGRYDAHIDKIIGSRVRKLSIVVQLTDPKEYKGCDLELIASESPIKINRERGYMCMFPSYVLHRVTPIEKGTRHSLVGWITGKPFK